MKHLVLLAALFSCAAPGAWAQSFCASDGQPRPVRLMERFINADCDSCWTDPATPKPGPRAVALDWVTPGSKGDDAPLSTVATRDALARLEALGQGVPAGSQTRTHAVKGLNKGSTLRVAHGLPLANYLGASIELKPIPVAAKTQRWTSWLALVETPARGHRRLADRAKFGQKHAPVHMGRAQAAIKNRAKPLFEARSMSITQGANPNRLRVIGWVEDEKATCWWRRNRVARLPRPRPGKLAAAYNGYTSRPDTTAQQQA
ncbi:hypothetical protein LP416_22550 [Polaromonas sp. P2-4]|nr:hypothetical protein LP416_22550 [Polaromonas sp. P2-4]